MAVSDFDVRMLKSCSSQGETAMWVKHAHTSQQLDQTGCPTSPAFVHEEQAFSFSLCTTCVNSIVMAGVSRELWIFQTNHNRR